MAHRNQKIKVPRDSPIDMSASFTPPGETSSDLWVERSNLNGVILSGVAYGILFVLATQAILLLLKPSRGKRIAWQLIAYICFLFTLATIGFAGNVKFNQMTYIDDRNIPGGPNAFTAQYYNDWVNILAFASYTVMSWAADALVLWRFVVVWNYKYWICVIPILIYLGAVSSSIALLVAMTKPGASFWSQIVVKFSIAYWSLSISLNIILTLLISGRLLFVRHRIETSLGTHHAQMYSSLVALLVESAALYSVTGLIFIISYARNSPFQNLVLPALGQIQGIAPVLILLRVAQGRAWSQPVLNTNRSTIVAKSTPDPIPLSHIGFGSSDMTARDTNGSISKGVESEICGKMFSKEVLV